MTQCEKAQLLTLLKKFTSENLADMPAESIDAVRQTARDIQNYEPETVSVEQLREQYPKGARIILLTMGPDPRPLPDNILGTVDVVDDIGTVHCVFDNGRLLGLIPGIDAFLKL